jgi:hypothetical protein
MNYNVYDLGNVNSKAEALSPKKNSTMINEKNILVKVTSLIAREEKTPPIGMPTQKNRDIGFASVFLSLENHVEKNKIVMIQKIEIRNLVNGKSQSFNFKPKRIELKPLENSQVAFHLTNKTGYSGQDKVKALITYQIGEEVKKIESQPVEIDKH